MDQVQGSRLSRGGHGGEGLLENGKIRGLLRRQDGLSLLRKPCFGFRYLALQISGIELELADHGCVGVVTLKLVTQLSLQSANLFGVGSGRFPKRGIDLLKLLNLFGAQLQGFLHSLYLRTILSPTPIAARGAATWKLRGQVNTK